jgi:hypothetical protein
MVAAVPALTVGVALCIERSKRPWEIWVAAPLFIWGTMNSVLLVHDPGLFLGNRGTCNTCYVLARKLGWGGATGTYRLVERRPGAEAIDEDLHHVSNQIEFQLRLKEVGLLENITIVAENSAGRWTTKPDSASWGIAVYCATAGRLTRLDPKPRRDVLGVPACGEITLRIRDNGSLAGCGKVATVFLEFVDGRRLSILARCGPEDS